MDVHNVFVGRSVIQNGNNCKAGNMNEGFNRFRKIAFFALTGLLVVFAAFTNPHTISNDEYISLDERSLSPVNSTYYIDPVKGSDDNKGTDKNSPWRSFDNINSLILTKGNTVKILSPGDLRSSLYVIAKGTEKEPVTIEFATGVYNFYPENALKKSFYVSNTNDSPEALKSVAFYIFKSKNIKFKGEDAEFLFRGKVIETVVDSSENVLFDGIRFDYKRPTVSEMKIISVSGKYAIAEIHQDSWYKIRNNELIWMGEGWQYDIQKYWQVLDTENDDLYRKGLPVKRLNFTDLGQGKIRIDFDVNPGFKKGFVYQNRNTFRDYVGNFARNSKNITWKDVNVYFMHGMGFVSQFCENIIFENVSVAPRDGSGRTCAAWADILHFSGCKGKIEIKNCFLSAANDDAVNVHGTHLRIVDLIPDKNVKVKFMHPQTYGFYPFFSGDSIEFINEKTLLPIAGNVVSEVKKLDEKEYELTFKDPVPQSVKTGNVIENITWTPDVTIKGTTIKHIPTRGVLLTTRGKIVVENNEFYKTHMSGILISDDANSWYESGYVTDVTIRNNRFIECGKPVVNIHPENLVSKKNEFVHSNIRIENNFFKLLRIPALSAKSSENISFIKNKIEVTEKRKISDLVKLKACSNVETDRNSIKIIKR